MVNRVTESGSSPPGREWKPPGAFCFHSPQNTWIWFTCGGSGRLVQRVSLVQSTATSLAPAKKETQQRTAMARRHRPSTRVRCVNTKILLSLRDWTEVGRGVAPLATPDERQVTAWHETAL